MSKNYVDYMVEETKNILAIDSPSGYTKEVADYVMGEYKKLGYEPKLTVRRCARTNRRQGQRERRSFRGTY